MIQSLNEIHSKLIEKGVLTDDILEAFAEIDGMGSTGTIAWMINTCKDAIDRMESGKEVLLNNTLVTLLCHKGVLFLP